MNLDRKASYGSSVAVITGLVSWVLVTYVFHHQLPQPVADALPVIVSTILGAVTAYFVKHDPKILAALSFYAANKPAVAPKTPAVQKVVFPDYDDEAFNER